MVPGVEAGGHFCDRADPRPCSFNQGSVDHLQKRESLMSMDKLETGDPVKVHDNWSKRGTLISAEWDDNPEVGDVIATVHWDGTPLHMTETIPLNKLVHLSYTWPEEWIPL